MTGKSRAAPTLETARLTLRPFRAGDLDAQAAMLGDPDTVRFLGGTPWGREESWRKTLCGPGLWVLLGYGYWAIERRADARCIGQLGFADFKRAIEPSIEGIPEIGWIVAGDAAGHGYASEAARAALDWADRILDAREIVAIIDAGNAPSIRIAEKLGFDVRDEAVYRGEPILIFRRRRG